MHNYGPVTSALPVLLPRRGPDDPSSAWLAKELRRRAANSRMRRFRAVPLTRRAWYVELSVINSSEASFRSGQLIPGLTWEPQKFWVRARRVARSWAERDRAAGGIGSMFPVELRHCKVCARILIGQQAADYRVKERRPRSVWEFTSGPACSVECQPKPIIRNSKLRRKANETC
jgi:hypothetical protein